MSKRSQEIARQRQQQAQNQRQVLATRQEWIAPLPHPDTLARFDEVVPGLADRIVKMAEDNATDRLANNRAVRWGAILGQIFAFVLSMTGILGGVYLIANGHSVSGLTALVTALGVPLAALIRRKLKPE